MGDLIRMAHRVVYLVIPAFLFGCMLNSVTPLPTGWSAREGRAVVVYGVGMEGDWSYPRYTAEFDEYSLKDQVATGNCFVFNRMEATIPSTAAPVTYFAFDVPPGAYVSSAFDASTVEGYAPPFVGDGPASTARPGGPLAGKSLAYLAGDGQIVYFGNFIYSRDHTVVIRRDLDALKQAAAQSLPDLRGEIRLAKEMAVKRPVSFLCTP